MVKCKIKKRILPSSSKCAKSSVSRWQKCCKGPVTFKTSEGFKVLAGGNGMPPFTKGDIYLDGNTVVTGKLTVTGNIDPPSLILDERSSIPAETEIGKGILWLKDDVPNALIFTNDVGTDFDLTSSPILASTWTEVLANGNVSGGGGTANPTLEETDMLQGTDGTDAGNLNIRGGNASDGVGGNTQR